MGLGLGRAEICPEEFVLEELTSVLLFLLLEQPSNAMAKTTERAAERATVAVTPTPRVRRMAFTTPLLGLEFDDFILIHLRCLHSDYVKSTAGAKVEVVDFEDVRVRWQESRMSSEKDSVASLTRKKGTC